MSEELRRTTGVVVPHDAWDLTRVPDHLRLTFRVEDERGTAIGEGKDLHALRAELAPTVRQTVAKAAADVERGGLTSWSFGELPETFEQHRDGHPVKGYPALVDEGQSVGLRVLGSRRERDRETWRGTRRLLTLTIPSPLKHVVGRLETTSKLALGNNPHGSVPALLADCLDCAVDDLMTAHGGGVATDQQSFDRLREAVRADLPETTYDVVVTVAGILALAHEIDGRVRGSTSPALLPSLVDVRDQVARLVRPGFVTDTGRARLRDLHRYLRAVQLRLDALPNGAPRDQTRMAEVAAVQAEVDAWLAAMPPPRRDDPSVRQVVWMVEELRVSLFAQQLGTPHPVSAKRIYKAMDALDV
jgi:ATP-dependent helicase HrpA